MSESSREPIVASTIDCAVPPGKTMTIVSGSVPCSIVSLRGVNARGEADAMGFVEGCASTRGAVAAAGFELSISRAGVSGMLMKRTYKTTNAMTKDRHSAIPIVGDDSLRDPCR
jgi:hypothetical protein